MQISNRHKKASFVCAMLPLGLLFVPLSALHAQPAPAAQSAPATNIPDQKLDKLAAALVQVSSLQQSYKQQMAEAATPAAKDIIAKEADDAIAKAVTKEGLSLEEYDSIITVAQNDPGVRDKILQRINHSTK